MICNLCILFYYKYIRNVSLSFPYSLIKIITFGSDFFWKWLFYICVWLYRRILESYIHGCRRTSICVYVAHLRYLLILTILVKLGKTCTMNKLTVYFILIWTPTREYNPVRSVGCLPSWCRRIVLFCVFCPLQQVTWSRRDKWLPM